MTKLTDSNADLMDPIIAIMRESKKDLPTKVGVLIDLAGTLLATSDRADNPTEMRMTAEEMRKRLIQATRLHRLAFEARQENARAALNSLSDGATKTPLRVVSRADAVEKA